MFAFRMESETVTKWLVGFNTPGYMPEMEPYLVDGVVAAGDALIDEIISQIGCGW